MLYLIALVVIGVLILIKRPWGKATLFGGDIKVEFKEWESAMGGVGKTVTLQFNMHGEYSVTIDSPTFKQEDIIIHQYEVTLTPMIITIDIKPYETNLVKVTIKELKEDGQAEICHLRAF
jgi:hypothetical protein